MANNLDQRKQNLDQRKQNVTINLSAETIRKAKVLAAQQSTSISGLLAEQIELLVGTEELYKRSERAALALLETGFHLDGVITASRGEWHERSNLCRHRYPDLCP